MTSLARNGVVALAFIAGAVASALVNSALMRSRSPAAVPSATRATQTDPAAYMPSGIRGLVLADVAQLRGAPSLRRFFDAERPGDPCEARLLRRVRRMAVAFAGESFDEFGVAFTGDLPREELIACARARRQGSEMRSERYRGVELARMSPRRESGLLPPANAAEIAYLPGGVVLAGSPDLVRRMIDHGMAGGDAGLDPESPVGELRRRVGAGHTVEVALYMPGSTLLAEASLDPAFRHVVGVALGASFDQGVRAVAVLACDDFDSPRAVATGIETLRTRLQQQLTLPAFAAPLRALAIQRRAADVRLELNLEGSELDALMTAVEGALSLLANERPAEPAPPPNPAPPRDS